jgi:histidinol-phosphate aminotransferase
VPEHLRSLTPYVPGKPAEELERELGIEHALKLASNESPLGPSPRAVEAMQRAAAGVHRYPDADAHALRTRLAAFHSVAPDEIVFGNGSNELIDLICRVFATPDDHAVIGVPSFVCYDLCLRIAGVPVTRVALRDHLHWELDRLAEAVEPHTRLLFVDNPNNPTGSHAEGAALERLLAEVHEDVLVVIDEAYVHFADAAEYVSALELRALRSRLIVLRTFSKAYGLAGVRAGYAIGPASLIDVLQRVRAPFNLSSIAQAAALAALDDPDHVAACVALTLRERARLAAELAALGLEVAPSQGNFLCVGLGRPAAPICDALLRQGVIVRPLGPPLERYVRITVGLAAENARLLSALAQAL